AFAGGVGVAGSPAVARGRVFVGARDSNLYAFTVDGYPLWTAQTGGPITASPAVANGVVYVGSWNGAVYAFDAASGRKLWSAGTGGRITPSPVVADGRLYVASEDGYLYAYDLPSRPAPPRRPDPAALVPDPTLDLVAA